MIKNWVDADSAWTASGFFTPKMTVICGNCQDKWTTKDYIQITNMSHRLADICPTCKRWNITNLVLT